MPDPSSPQGQEGPWDLYVCVDCGEPRREAGVAADPIAQVERFARFDPRIEGEPKGEAAVDAVLTLVDEQGERIAELEEQEEQGLEAEWHGP